MAHAIVFSEWTVHQKVLFEIPIQQLRTCSGYYTLNICATTVTASYRSAHQLTVHEMESHGVLAEIVPEHE